MQQFKTTINKTLVTGLTTTQFKTAQCQIQFAAPLNKQSAPKRALLAYVLKAVSQSYPTRQLMNRHLESLYAAHIRVGIKKIGDAHIITFYLSTIHQDYTLNQENLLAQLFDTLSNMLYHPLFKEHIFQEEKQAMIDYLNELSSDPLKYAFLETYQHMYEKDTYRTRSTGDIDDILPLTLDDIKDAYQSMIETDQLYVQYVGADDANTVYDLVRTFITPTKQQSLSFISPTDFDAITENKISLTKPIQQTKLIITYRLKTTYTDDDYYKAVVFNALLGGGSDSLLFHKVRNEAGLCYFIGSSYDQFKGSLIIYTGIEQQNQEKVQLMIQEIITDIQQKNISSHALDLAKNALVTSLKASLDSPYTLLNHLAKGHYFNNEFNPEQTIKRILAITEEDIHTMAKSLIPNITLLLEGDSDA